MIFSTCVTANKTNEINTINKIHFCSNTCLPNRTPRKPALMIILIADDDADNRMFLEQAMRQNGYDRKILFVEDGEELMEYLRRQGRYNKSNAP